ncbi:MAG: hypothetical protein LBM27_03660 [Lactobacillaceae bacterium]|jgi:predicted SnoaL-like aldol condensation-catalyzing enzyme|nr:hypothetical protein [Lactobacillaceae bacterium]
MSNIQTAKNLVGTFVSGDVEVARQSALPTYIQHNLDFGNGLEAFIEAVEGLQQAPVKTTLETVREFEDGDYVILQNKINFAGSGDATSFDVFRFEGDKIAEHWDNVTPVVAPNPSGHTQLDGATEVSDLDKTEENKTLVENFVKDVLMGAHPEKIEEYLAGEDYIQHNTGIADGVSGVSAAFAKMAEDGVAMEYQEIHKVLGQGNFVLVMGEGKFAGQHVGFYDLFRVTNSKIVEHWDIIQEIPAESEWKNQNGKF